MRWPVPLGLDPDPPGHAYPPTPTRPRVVVYGDSYSGSWEASSAAGWLALLADALDVETVNQAVSGSGYVDLGRGSTFPYAATMYPQPDAAVAVVMGSQNDYAQHPDAVRLAAAVTLRAVTVRAPAARLLVVGPYWWTDEPSAAALATRDAVRDAAAGVGAVFLDPIEGRWLTARPGLIAADGRHPSWAGYAAIAHHLRPAVAELLAAGRIGA
jgi:lysophospholipase L1-like esterase